MSVDHDSIKANDLLVEGKRLYDAGKYEEAVASFDKAIEIKPINFWIILVERQMDQYPKEING